MEKEHSIKGKKILFFSPAFFDYESKIKSKMQEMGAIVDLYDGRSVTKARDRALMKIFPNIFNNRTIEYFNNILKENKDKNYDYIFIVKCDMMSKEILEEYHKTFPNAIFCLYLWDSIKNIKGISEKFGYFHRVFSFDKKDVEKTQNLQFRPLFYLDIYKKEVKTDNNYKYDFCFCGTIHADRFKIIKKIFGICNEKKYRFYTYCYLQSNFIYYFYKITKSEFRLIPKEVFSFTKLSSQIISDLVDDSRVILDIQHPKQSGLTMRTIEMVGMNKKLVTTNQEIKKYDFYNPENILVIDRENIVIPDAFLLTEYQSIDPEIYKNYSLENWINDIFI